MGHALCEMIANRSDCRVVAGIDQQDGEQNGIPVYDSLEKLDGKGDVIIDFSAPAAVEKALTYCEAHKMPIVVCTTGLSEELQLKVVQLSRIVPVFKSANMSIGINLLSELCKRASAILGADYDVEIVEQHHHNKLDAPSGTALMPGRCHQRREQRRISLCLRPFLCAPEARPQGDRHQLRARRQHRGRPRGAVLRSGRGHHPQAYCIFPQCFCKWRNKCCCLSCKKGGRACTIWVT